MRELEQAQFSLELLKGRATGAGAPGAPLPEEPVPGSGPSEERDGAPRSPRSPRSPRAPRSPRGLPASPSPESREPPPPPAEDMETEGSRSPHRSPPGRAPPGGSRSEEQRAMFYISADQSPVHQPEGESPGRGVRERRESGSRRPVVVVISMQKESPVDEAELQAAPALGRTPDAGGSASGLGSGPTPRPTEPPPAEQPVPPSEGGSPQAAPSPPPDEDAAGSPALCSSEVDVRSVLEPRPSLLPGLPSQQDRRGGRPAQASPSVHVLETKPPKAQKKSSAQTVIVNMTEKPAAVVFSPPRRKLPFSK